MSAVRNTISPSTRGQNQTAVGAAPRADRQTVTFGEVARECRETARGAVGAKIVGLEHLDPEDLELKRFDEGGDNTFTKSFKKGQMLFGRRRAYLKKAALAPFDGICSGDITVIEAIPEKLDPALLPFLVQNDAFFAYAVGGSAGSLSPRVKWEHLAAYSFSLPPLAEQKKLAEALWAMERVKRAYKKLLAETDRLVEARFVEMFGDPVKNDKGWPIVAVKEVCSHIVDCPHTTPVCVDGKSDFPAIRTAEIKNGRIDWASMRYVSKEVYLKRIERLTPEAGDIVYAREGSFGDAVVLPSGYCFCLGQRTMLLRPKFEVCDGIFLWYMLRSEYVLRQAQRANNATTVGHVNVKDVKAFIIPLPPLPLQREFAAFVGRAEKAKESLKGALKALTAAQKTKMNAAFREGGD